MPKDGRNKINLESCKPEDSSRVEYFDPTVGGGATRSFDPPSSSPMVVYLKSLSEDESDRYNIPDRHQINIAFTGGSG